MPKRSTRAKEFKGRGNFAFISFHQDNLSSALLLLQQASLERAKSQYKEQGGHYSVHAPASIVLVSTAFDQWLNESCLVLDVRYSGLRDAASDMDTIARYYYMCEAFSDAPVTKSEDLQMVWDVRNEIIHLLPRTTASGDSWPSWLAPLEARGLVQSARLPGRAGDANDLGTKLHSYRLCYWVWETLTSAIETLLARFPDDMQIERSTIDWSLPLFARYKEVEP